MKANANRPVHPAGARGTGNPSPAKPARARRRIGRLAAVALLILLVCYAVVRLATDGPDGQKPTGTAFPTASTPVSGPSASASHSTATGTPTPAATMGLEGADPDHPTLADLASRKEIAVPAPFIQSGWELVRLLTDGRMILNSGSRLSVYDPATGAETVVREAEFGIQAAANDRFLAFGAGGDEMTEIFLHSIRDNYTESVLQDTDGFLDLEMTRANGLLASRIRYTGEEAVLDAWIRFDAVTYATATLPSADRSYARYLFSRAYPSKNAVWTYDVGKPWHQAWLDDAESLFYAEVTRAGRTDYELKLYRSTASGKDPLLFRSASGALPEVTVAHNLLLVGDDTAMRTDTDRWIRADFASLANDGFPYGGRLVAAGEDGLLVAALDRHGHLSTLYRVPSAG